MPDSLDSNGLQTKTLTEIKTELEDGLKTIYGSDINVDQDTPDGQLIALFGQAAVDLREVLQQVNSNFDPDQAFGRVLDQRVGINNITRNGGSFTVTPVEITVDRALSLVGLDTESETLNPVISNLYTVKDDAGTLFYLQDSQTIAGAGTYSFPFRAAEIGEVLVTPNTITTPESVIAGVTGVNNPAGVTTQGEDEETDSALKIRRSRSISISAVGPLDTIEARILDVTGVTFAKVYENSSNVATDPNGTPPNHIWCLAEGGADADIGEAIYNTKAPGVGMRGSESVNVTRPDGRLYEVNFDRPIDQNLWIEFTLAYAEGNFSEDEVKEAIVTGVNWEVGQDATGDVITCFLKELNSSFVVTNMRVSDDDITYVEQVSPTNVNYRFINSTTRITIN